MPRRAGSSRTTSARSSRIARSSSRRDRRSSTRAGIWSSAADASARVSRSMAACNVPSSGGVQTEVQTEPLSPCSSARPRSFDLLEIPGGERGIRTHGTLTGTPDFESGSFGHSDSSPRRKVQGEQRVVKERERDGAEVRGYSASVVLRGGASSGEMTEWPKVHDWKSCEPARVPRVRIPVSPLGYDAPHDSPGHDAAHPVGQDSDIHSISELAGKRLATPQLRHANPTVVALVTPCLSACPRTELPLLARGFEPPRSRVSRRAGALVGRDRLG